jgi:hypothetical protein
LPLEVHKHESQRAVISQKSPAKGSEAGLLRLKWQTLTKRGRSRSAGFSRLHYYPQIEEKTVKLLLRQENSFQTTSLRAAGTHRFDGMQVDFRLSLRASLR